MAEIKFLSYNGLSQYDALIKGYVNDAVKTGIATSFKAVALSDDFKLHFYTETPIAEDATPAYTVELPFADYQKLVKTAVEGNLASFDANGQVVDSGIAMADVATKKYVDDAVKVLSDKVGTVPEGSTVMGIIQNIQENAYDDTEIRGLISDNADAIAAEAERAAGVEQGLETRLKAVEDDHLVAADKTELSNAIAAEKQRAEGIEGGLETRLAAVEADYLVEADKTELADAIKAISDDYLVEADKTELQNAINAEAEAARAAEKANADAIAAEKERAEGVEAGLDERLVEVETFFKTAEGETLDTALDTLVEIQKYLDGEGEVADQMILDIAANKKAIEDHIATDHDFAGADAALKEEIMTDVNKKADQTALEAEIDRATKAEAQALTDAKAYTDAEVLKDRNRLDALEAKFDGDDSVADQIADALQDAKDYTDALAEGAVAANAEEIAKINDAETGILKQAKDYVDGKDSAMNARVEALEAIDHDHDNKEVLDGITAEQVEAWDAAEQNAKDYAKEYVDGLNETMAGRMDDAEAAIEDIEESLAEGGATANAIKAAQDAADKAQGEVDALEEVVATKAAQADLEAEVTRATAKEAELVAADSAMDERIKALEAVEHVEITEAEIKALFGITE